MKKWLCFVALVTMTCPLPAQEPRFLQHDLGDANTGIMVQVVLQDKNCMIWLGTKDGLARYDGMNVQWVSLPGDSSGTGITALMEDRDGNIWAGSETGHIFYLDGARHSHAFKIEEGHPSKKITGIAQDTMGQLWFSTYGEGVYVYTGTRLYNFNTDDGLTSNEIYTMSAGPDLEIWLGTDSGINICRFDPASGEGNMKHIRLLDIADGLPDKIITALKADREGNMFVGTFEQGIICVERRSGKIKRPVTGEFHDRITAITLFDDDEIWFGTHAEGLWHARVVPGKEVHPEKIYALKTGNINDLIADQEGNLWIAIQEFGLYSCFRPFAYLEGDIGDIRAMYCDDEDQLWIGTEQGVYRIEHEDDAPGKFVLVSPPQVKHITDLLIDPFGHLWISTQKGLFVMDVQSGVVTAIPEIFELDGAFSMDISREAIWIATFNGVVSYSTGKDILKDQHRKFTRLTEKGNPGLHWVMHVFVDSQDQVWFATDGDGVFRWREGHLDQYAGTTDVPLTKVYSICEDHAGHMWFSTPDAGLVEFDGVAYHPLSIREGLGAVAVSSMQLSGTGDLLIAHNGGLDILETARRHFMYYGDEIGAKGIEPGLNAIAVDRQKNIYVGCRGKIFKYIATKHKLSIHPRTQLTRVSVFDQQIDFNTKHSFSHSQNYFRFDYVGLWYTNPSTVKYLYKLEGYDREWKESRDNAASYSHLGPGDYTFYVKASENRNFLDEPITSYSFTIAKPIWLQVWFIVLTTLVSGGLFYWLVKSRDKRAEKHALLQKEMVESQLSALKAQINPHFLFNSFNTLITIIDENAMNPAVAIEYVEKLADFYRSILQYREQETISLEEEFDVVRNFGYLLEQRYGKQLRLHLSTPVPEAYILPLTLQRLVENAVKHNIISQEHPLDVHITVDHDDYVTVRNNLQPKSRTEPSTQFGLHSIIKQYQLLSDRKVIVQPGPDAFVVRIPVFKRKSI